MKKKDSSLPRPSSVCEEELQALVPDATPEAGTSDDDENETIALRRRRREDRTTEGGSRGVSTGDRGISEVPRKFPASEGQQGRLMGDSSAHITEGSETRVSGHPKETPEDGFKFEFNRELPLACYPEDCARLLQLVKGGPDQLPPVGDLLFKDEYEHAACSFVKSHGDWNVLVEKYDTALRRTREQVREGEEARKKTEEALRIALWDKSDAITREKALRKAFDETRTSDAVELQMCKDSMKNLELVLDKLAKEKAELEKARAAESLKYEEEMNRLHKSRRYEVTHERIRVMIAMIAKAEKRFHQISLCEVRRDKYEEARCLQGQAFGTRRCLERIKDAGTEILREIIETYAGQEEHYEREAARLEVKEIPEEDLRLCPLVLESRFLIDEIWRQIDPFGSNFYLIDSEAAIALRTPRADRDPPSEDQMKEPAQTAGSSTQRADQDADLTKQMSIDSVIPKDGAVPTIVLTDSPAKASENLSSSTSSSEELEKEDGVSAGRPEGVSTVNEDPPILTFGRISGPGEKDGAARGSPRISVLYCIIDLDRSCCSGKNSKKKKKNTEARKESNEVEQTDVDDSSKKGGKKRKAGDPPAEDAPKKKKMKKKDSSLPRPSSVCEEELQALVPDATPEAGTSDDDENETIALRRRRREGRTTEGGSREVTTGDWGISEVPSKLPASEGQPGRLMADSSAHITEGSETRVSGCPKETPEDEFKFEFNRELPLACYPGDCASLLQLVKGGPDQLPPVGDLLFKDEYEHAACSSVKSQGDWNVLVEKYNTALKQTREQVREALRKAFDETRTFDPVELQMCKESMKNLKLRADQDADRTKQTSIDAVIPKDGTVPTIVLTDSPAKASKNLSSSTSSSGELEKEDGVSAGRPEGVSTVNEDPPVLTFGRNLGPGEKDSAARGSP
ncbi:hypothetical protein F2Q69_00021707 [Brassica cretica]|uniref:Uncharacterized protein n=1 Tax=Brassica cretica TaxID=69181 RepID=A0A8S9Q7A5_BRACR|nr:hypothetical protein F2Q69_00021707 [Brassica cretica]